MHSYLDKVPSPSPSFASMDPRRVADIELDSVFMAQHEHTLRARNLPRVPASPTSVPSSPASASFYTSSEQAKRPFRRLPEPPKPKMRRLPEPPMPSPRSVRSFASSSSAQSSASSSSSGSSDSAYTSYLTFDDDSDSDSDSLDEPSDFTWSYVEFQGKAFPLPQTSIPSISSRHHAHHRTNSRSPLSQPPTTHSQSKQRSQLSPPNHSTSQILREIGAKELEPIGPAMEPAIFADDGAQGDWRQLVDDLFMRD